jgi:hypothetical protein
MKSLVTQLSYPVLCLPLTFGVRIALTPKDLSRSQAILFWRAQFYEGLQLIETDGSTYEVVETRITRPVSNLGQRLGRFLDLPVSVELTLKLIQQASIESIVKAIDAAIDSDSETFEEFSGHSVAWWKENLARSSSVPELMQAFL